MAEVTLGGERLGSGKKNKVYLREYERSTHDLSYTWKSTMASGTLVPFMSELALPGDTFDIDLETQVMTHPTIGPLFGSYKVQLDLFSVPVRLYNPKLHMNMLGIGLDMKNVFLPQVKILSDNIFGYQNTDNAQINSSAIFSYLNIRGLGFDSDYSIVGREFNAVPYLAYWDIYKNYYANKSEEIGYVIHNPLVVTNASISRAKLWTNNLEGYDLDQDNSEPTTTSQNAYFGNRNNKIIIEFDVYEEFDLDKLWIFVDGFKKAKDVFNTWNWDPQNAALVGTGPLLYNLNGFNVGTYYLDYTINQEDDVEPQLIDFQLANIDQMRLDILQSNGNVPFVIDNTTYEPYGLPLYWDTVESVSYYSAKSNQEGLAIKTYQSDLFNNWMSTEWIDGENGINEITRISTEEGFITIDEINLSKKIYDMLNRIAVSGGSYDDWLDATYTHDRIRSAENPVYQGGLSRELVFQEVISTAAVSDESKPLGSLAGRGILTNKRKGGKTRIKIDEPSYIMGIVSLTPRICYSQGNKWDTNLKTLDDFHKPALDEIGFQDLITDQMAYFDTSIYDSEVSNFKSAGKQPAWINYMTNVDVVRGNFADQNEQMWMTLNRRYEVEWVDDEGFKPRIKDLTTYIDPIKFNHIFADTRRDAQNFWVQIACDITARRKMSAKVMPNL